MQAIITAGGKLKKDNPLFQQTGIEKKALLPMAGQPMIYWVVQALITSKYIERLIIVGLQPGDFDDTNMPVDYIDDQGSMIDNIQGGIRAAQANETDAAKLVLCSSDIPLLTSDMVDEFVTLCQEQPGDIFYTVVEDHVMEKRFPNSNRTFTKMKDGRFAGGDIIFINTAPVQANEQLFRDLVGRRKSFLSQARMVGFTFILRFLLGIMDTADAAKRVSKALNINGQVIKSAHAEIAMDVDKLSQYLLVKKEVEALRL